MHFTETEGSVLHPQPTTDPLHEPYESISSQPIPFRHFLILSTHPCLGHSQSLFPSHFCTKIVCIPFSPQYTTCTTHLTLLNLTITTLLDKQYKSQNLSLYSLFQHPIPQSTLDPTIFHNSLFSNTHSLTLP
jgi:hypothetical protein